MDKLVLLILGLFAAIAAGAYGYAQGWKTIKTVRQPAKIDDVLAGWLDDPLNMWVEDPVAGLFITLHTAAVCCLALLQVAYLFLHAAFSNWLILLLSLFCVAFSATLAGNLVAFPFARKAIRPVLVQLTSRGVVSGQAFVSWKSISHYQVDPERRIIRIFPVKTRGVAVNAWQVKDEALWQDVLATLRQHLPSATNQQKLTNQKTAASLIGWLVFCTLLSVGSGIILLWLPSPYTPAYYPLAIVGLLVFGTILLRQYGLSAEDPLPQPPPRSQAEDGQ